MIISNLVSVILCSIGFPLVWGILDRSMPRSGGEYIYNSRTISPLIGIAGSFGNALVWTMWIYILAPWTVDPDLMMAQLLDIEPILVITFDQLDEVITRLADPLKGISTTL